MISGAGGPCLPYVALPAVRVKIGTITPLFQILPYLRHNIAQKFAHSHLQRSSLVHRCHVVEYDGIHTSEETFYQHAGSWLYFSTKSLDHTWYESHTYRLSMSCTLLW